MFVRFVQVQRLFDVQIVREVVLDWLNGNTVSRYANKTIQFVYAHPTARVDTVASFKCNSCAHQTIHP